MVLFLSLVAAFVLAADPAYADPISAAVAWVSSTFMIGTATAAAIVNIGLGIASSLLSAVIAKAAAQRPAVDVKFDVDLGDDTPLSFVLGRYVTAGKRKYVGSWGKNTRYMTEVREISCLPISGLAAIWVDDEAGAVLWGETDTDDTGYDLGHPVTNYDDDGHRIWVRIHDGTQTAADPMLVSVFGSDPDYPWTSAMVGRGKAYVVITTRYDSDTLTSYPAYLFEPEPLPLYDLRKDSTAGGEGPHRWGQRATYEPTTNPAVIAYNITRGIYFGSEWIWGGRNLAAWRLPAAEWMAAANECDAPISLAAGGTEPAYRCGAEIAVNMQPADVLEEIGRAANMRFAEVGGRLKPVVGLPGAAVFSFTDDDIVVTQGQSFKPFNALGETFNALGATYPEPTEKWSTKDAAEYVDAAATEDDGGRYLPTSISYPAAPYRRQVRRLMRAQMRDFRRMRQHQFHLPPDAYALEPGVDMVSWTSQRNGYINKLFVVEAVAKTAGMLVAVTLREVDPSDYDWSSDFEVPTTVVVPVNPPISIQPISGFGAEGVTIRDGGGAARRPALRIFCAGDEVGVTDIQLQVRLAGSSQILLDVKRPFGAPFQWFVQDVLPMQDYEVRGQLLSQLRRRSVWSAWVTATTPDVRIGRDDIDEDILADLDEALDWIGLGEGMVDELRDQINADLALVNGRVDEAQQAITDQGVAIRAELAAGLEGAEGYTQTQIASHDLIVQGRENALSGRIDELTAALTSENLINNGVFATDATGWAQTNSPRVTKTGSSTAIVLAAPEEAMILIGQGAAGNIVTDLNEFEVTTDDRMQLRFWAASTAASRVLQFSVQFQDALGADIEAPTSLSVTITPANAWKVYSFQIDPPDNAEGATVTITKTQSGTGVYFTRAVASTVNIAIEARISELEAAWVDPNGAFLTFQQSINARVGLAEGSVTTERGLRISGDNALGTRIDNLTTTVGNNTSRIGTAETTIATQQEAISQLRTDVVANFGEMQRVKNPDFRSDLANWTHSGLSASWTVAARIAVRDRAASQLFLSAMPNSKSLRILADDATGARVFSSTFEVTQAEKYTIGFWSYRVATAPVVKMFIRWIRADDTTFTTTDAHSAVQTPSDQMNAWVYNSKADIIPPADAVRAQVVFLRVNVAAGAGTWTPVTGATMTRQEAYDAWSSSQISVTAAALSALDQSFAAYQISLNSRLGGIDGTLATQAGAIGNMYTRAQTDSAIAAALIDVSAMAGEASAYGRMRVSAYATAAGSVSRVGLAARAEMGGTVGLAALFLEAMSDGTSRVSVVADRFAIVSGTGATAARTVPFYVDGGVTYIRSAVIQNATIGKLKLATGSVTLTRTQAFAPASTDNTVTWHTVGSYTWSVDGISSAHIELRHWSPVNNGGADTVRYRWLLDGAAISAGSLKNGGNSFPVLPGGPGEQPVEPPLSARFQDFYSLGAGNHTLTLQMVTSGSHGQVAGRLRVLEWMR